ncbi:MAG TPA: APC family permease [Candidatus Eremiobacteraceae bacterium]|jgi:amino acid transporter
MIASRSAPADEPEQIPHLKRAMTLSDVVLFFVLAGSNFQWVATAAAAGPSALPAWIVGGVLMFVPLAIVVVYLTSHHPDEGGLYVWAKKAFGPLPGFLTGWTYWCSNLPYFPALLYFMAGNALYISGTSSALAGSPLFFISMSIGGLIFATVINIYGLGVGKWLNNVGAITRWTGTMILIAIGIIAWVKFGSATPINFHTMTPTLDFKSIIFWSVIAFAWTGPEAASFMGGEIKDPRRSIPRGLAYAAPAIAAIYVLGTASVLAAVPSAQVDPSSGVMQTISHAATRLGWNGVSPIAAILVTVSCLGSAGLWLGAAARIPFVAGIDSFMPRAFGKLHPKYGSPHVALISQAVIAAVFVFLGQSGTTVRGAYAVLVSTTVLTTMLPFLFVFASAIKLYVKPQATDVLRIPGGKATIIISAVVGLFTTLSSIVLAVIPDPSEPNKALAVAKVLGMTALVVGSGILVFYTGRRRQATAS